MEIRISENPSTSTSTNTSMKTAVLSSCWVKSFGHQLWETIVEQAEMIILSSDIIPRRIEFLLGGQEYSLRFTSASSTSLVPNSPALTHLSEEEKRNVFMVSQTLMSTKW